MFAIDKDFNVLVENEKMPAIYIAELVKLLKGGIKNDALIFEGSKAYWSLVPKELRVLQRISQHFGKGNISFEEYSGMFSVVNKVAIKSDDSSNFAVALDVFYDGLKKSNIRKSITPMNELEALLRFRKKADLISLKRLSMIIQDFRDNEVLKQIKSRRVYPEISDS